MLKPFSRHRILTKYISGKVIAILVMTFLISACGFQLRGTHSTNFKKITVYLDSQTPFGELEKSLKRELKNAGAKLDSSGTSETHFTNNEAKLYLNLLDLELSSYGVSRDATGRANETLMNARLEYQLSTQPVEETTTPVSTLKVTRSFYQNYRDPVSEQNLRKQTQEELIQEIVRRLMIQMQWQQQATQAGQ